MIHDQELLDHLEKLPVLRWKGIVYRATWAGRDPLAGSAAVGRWSPRDQSEVLYTSLECDGAIVEKDFRLSLEPIRPTKPVDIHTIRVQTERTLYIKGFAELERLGIDIAAYQSLNYSRCQEIGTAVNFLQCDGLLVPNARFDCQNLVIFLGNHDPNQLELSVQSSEPVDWESWKSRQDDLHSASADQQRGSHALSHRRELILAEAPHRRIGKPRARGLRDVAGREGHVSERGGS